MFLCVNPILFNCDFALALRIRDAQHVMIGLSFGNDFTPAPNCCNGTFFEPLMCPPENSPGERTSRIIAPLAIMVLKSGPGPKSFFKNDILMR